LSPELTLDFGYAFATSKDYAGGPFSKLSFGLARILNDRTSAHLAVFVGAQLFDSELSELIDGAFHNYYGTTSLMSFGINLGFKF
jgi:hypothetical protein